MARCISFRRGATGADWAGRVAGAVLRFEAGAWTLLDSQIGWIAYVKDENLLLIQTGAAWVDLGLAVREVENLNKLGIGTTADPVNLLAVRTAAVLFNSLVDSIQLKLNKLATADTASMLLQTGFSGRAELGLCGDDNLHLKVSPRRFGLERRPGGVQRNGKPGGCGRRRARQELLQGGPPQRRVAGRRRDAVRLRRGSAARPWLFPTERVGAASPTAPSSLEPFEARFSWLESESNGCVWGRWRAGGGGAVNQPSELFGAAQVVTVGPGAVLVSAPALAAGSPGLQSAAFARVSVVSGAVQVAWGDAPSASETAGWRVEAGGYALAPVTAGQAISIIEAADPPSAGESTAIKAVATSRSAAIATGGTAQDLMAANPDRNGWS